MLRRAIPPTCRAAFALLTTLLNACSGATHVTLELPDDAAGARATTDAGAAADATTGAPRPAPSDAAAGAPSPARDAGDGFTCDPEACFDGATGLLWENPSGAAAPTWDEATRYCAALAIRGGGWRVPNIQELRSIIRGCPATELSGTCKVHDPDCMIRSCMEGCDQCQYPVVNGVRHCTWPDAFAGSCEHYTWTSSEYAESITPGVWYVDFGNGGWVHGAPKSIGGLVRCVRGPASAP